eukprot:365485-Chlamydomonas_euryale.AAC.2
MATSAHTPSGNDDALSKFKQIHMDVVIATTVKLKDDYPETGPDGRTMADVLADLTVRLHVCLAAAAASADLPGGACDHGKGQSSRNARGQGVICLTAMGRVSCHV